MSVLGAAASCPGVWAQVSDGKVAFSGEIRPLLADKCFACHGLDEEQRQGGLRLDLKPAAFAAGDSEEAIIVPGRPEASLLFDRISTDDDSRRMPPPDSGKTLDAEQIALIGRWIREGAPWQEHWSFVTPIRPTLPRVADAAWPRGAIDYFVLAQLEAGGLRPAPEADKETLLRRVTLDLTGLPPTLHQMDAFLADDSPIAYEKVVERLLHSPHFGERMAVEWLDVARYADTNGYHVDNRRDMWLWRDWVIHAFNMNMPFDQFTVEQLAGDLLPHSTHQQQVASGFNRNHGINFEAGAIDEEYRVEYVIDRVQTTSTAWMGLTLGCAQCHDHKYDPLTQRDFYRFFAFFNTIDEKGLDGKAGNSGPVLETYSALGGDKASTMVMREMVTPRKTYVLERGSYAAQGEHVFPGTPTSLPPLCDQLPANRLGLARWLTDPAHPLTARVAVNRYWQMVFGVGIVSTAEDFGTRGARPSHPALLDWLATEFIRSEWDLKKILRSIVTSSTYRQASHVALHQPARDAENRWLARGPRFRLQAEFIRDQALAVSELLCTEIGGPSVSPYQPAGLWQETAHENFKGYTAQKYVRSTGANLYRRSLYTFWKRSSPPPTMLAFDAPTRETCMVRRQRTNTPLQSLVLMNGPTYLEASRVLAEQQMANKDAEVSQQVADVFRRVTGRRPQSKEVQILVELYRYQLEAFRRDSAEADKLRAIGEAKSRSELDAAQHASLSYVISILFNLSETIVKP